MTAPPHTGVVMDTKTERKFDLRTLERNFAKGLISKDEYKTYLEKLADINDNADEFEAEFVENVLDKED